MKKFDVSAIRNLSSFARETKIGRLRLIFNDIEELISLGVPYQKIVDELNTQGLEISPSHFGTIISILRKKRDRGNSSTGISTANISVQFSQEKVNEPKEPKTSPSTGNVNTTTVNSDVPVIPKSAPGEPKKFNWEELKKIEGNWS